MANRFEIGDPVYLMESAKVGSLESYKVMGVRQDNRGWWYQIGVPMRPPTRTQTVGDFNQLKNSFDFELNETELGVVCEAAALAELYFQAGLSRIQLIRRGCGEGT